MTTTTRSPEEVILLKAFNALSKKEQRKVLAEMQYRTALALIEADPPNHQPIRPFALSLVPPITGKRIRAAKGRRKAPTGVSLSIVR